MDFEKNDGDLKPEETANAEGNISGEIEEIDELAKIKKQNEELLDKLQRNMAEFDNFRKRTVKEKASMYNHGVMSAIEKLLPVIDNFERAINAAANKDDSMYKGVVMIYGQLLGYLKDMDVEAIECVGKKFDPAFHNAVSHEKNDDYEENTVIEELQKGYKFKDTVLRPSFVKVAN